MPGCRRRHILLCPRYARNGGAVRMASLMPDSMWLSATSKRDVSLQLLEFSADQQRSEAGEDFVGTKAGAVSHCVPRQCSLCLGWRGVPVMVPLHIMLDVSTGAAGVIMCEPSGDGQIQRLIVSKHARTGGGGHELQVRAADVRGQLRSHRFQ